MPAVSPSWRLRLSTVGGYTSSRREFLGRAGSIQAPQAVLSAASLSNAAEVDGDPARPSRLISRSRPAASKVIFLLGDVDGEDQLAGVLAEARAVAFDDLIAAAFPSGMASPARSRSRP